MYDIPHFCKRALTQATVTVVWEGSSSTRRAFSAHVFIRSRFKPRKPDLSYGLSTIWRSFFRAFILALLQGVHSFKTFYKSILLLVIFYLKTFI